MGDQIDYKKEWEKTKKILIKFSEEASVVIKKGEKGIVKLSKQGKLHLDATSTNVKIEKLYYSIGKEYVKSKYSSDPSAALVKFKKELESLVKEQKVIKGKLSTQNKKKVVKKKNVTKKK